MVSELQTDQGTRSPIELLWTAKNHHDRQAKRNYILVVFVSFLLTICFLSWRSTEYLNLLCSKIVTNLNDRINSYEPGRSEIMLEIYNLLEKHQLTNHNSLIEICRLILSIYFCVPHKRRDLINPQYFEICAICSH